MQNKSNKMKNMRAVLLSLLVTLISLSVSAQNVTVNWYSERQDGRNRDRSFRS